MRNVTVIPASLNKFSDVPLATTKKRKVAAYARVSTDDEDQQTSYAAQCDYYERYIKSREDWEFVGLYSDEGISGCNTKNERDSARWCRMPWTEKSNLSSQNRSRVFLVTQ